MEGQHGTLHRCYIMRKVILKEVTAEEGLTSFSTLTVTSMKVVRTEALGRASETRCIGNSHLTSAIAQLIAMFGWVIFHQYCSFRMCLDMRKFNCTCLWA